MANSVCECEEMIEPCRQADCRLMVTYWLQYEANNLEAVRLVRSGEFGTLKFIDAQRAIVIGNPKQWRLKKQMAGGWSLMDIGVHCLQAARYLPGEEPIRVTAHARSTNPVKYREVEENIAFALLFSSGLAANCYYSYGMEGLNRFRTARPTDWVEMDPAHPYRGLRLRVWKEGPVEDRTLPAQDHLATEIDQFSKDVRAGRNPKASGEIGLQDLKIITVIYRAAETGTQVAVS